MFGNTVQLNLGGTRSDESIAYTGTPALFSSTHCVASR